MLSVAVSGLGGIGSQVVRALDLGVPGLHLVAASARDPAKAGVALDRLRRRPQLVPLPALADVADVVVECTPASVYDLVATPAVERGRILVTMSSGALLERPRLFSRARETGAQILIPSGGLLGFDGLRAAREGTIQSVKLITRKPPESFAGAPYLAAKGIDLEGLLKPLKLFDGNAREAASAFPANANVAASLSLAALGPDKTRVEIYAVPGLETLEQEVHVVADSCRLKIAIQSYPLPDNPRTGSLTPKSVIATLRGLAAISRIGT